jgi:hypothetical protein
VARSPHRARARGATVTAPRFRVACRRVGANLTGMIGKSRKTFVGSPR